VALAPQRVCVKINGAIQYLWRAVDHEGEILESFVTKTKVRKPPTRDEIASD
jgi:transposase-like protein